MKSQETGKAAHETFTVHSDNGAELTFTGVLASESSYFDEESGVLTKLRLFVTEESGLVYSIVSSSGDSRLRRFYSIKTHGEMCTMNDGNTSLNIPLDMLFTAVFGLCGIDPARAEEIRPVLEKMLQAANA